MSALGLGSRMRHFEYGIGKNAIPPLNQPRMLRTGERGYPSAGMGRLDMIGFNLEGEARGYPVRHLVPHEIVNETVGNLQAAVAY